MRLDSARELKASLLPSTVLPLLPRLHADALLVRTARAARDVDPVGRTLALGISPAGKGDFRVAVRVQRRGLEESPAVEAIRKKARGEVDVRYVGRVAKLAVPWFRSRKRPALIGTSIGHYRITAGTLGCFVMLRSGGEVRVLSNNHVLADEDRGRKGDAVIQPGAYDGGDRAKDRIGSLDSAVRLKRRGINRVDAALAALDAGVDYNPRTLTQVGVLSGVASLPLEDGDRVEKLGRTTGHTRGRITAFEIDNVVVGYDQGNLRFDDQLEVEGVGDGPFSQGGDSGSLIYTAKGRRAVGLLFAGSDQGGRNGKGLTYANVFETVLKQAKAELLF
jgi:hypothetical protein